MLQRLSPWLAAGITTGLVILIGLWLMAVIYFNTFLLGYRSAIDQKLIAAVIEATTNNQEVQNALRNHIILYLKSPEGKAKMVDILKSPEMVKALAENLQAPETRAAVLNLMKVPEFRGAVLQILKDTPEMKVLNILSTAIVIDEKSQSPPPGSAGQQ